MTSSPRIEPGSHWWKASALTTAPSLLRHLPSPPAPFWSKLKLHHKSLLIQLQQILWTCCVFSSPLNNNFFSVLVIIFRNKSYFCFNYTNTFFIHAMNYFSLLLRIIFVMCTKNYFLIGPRIIFRGIGNLFFGLQCIAGLAFEVDWFESFTSLGDHIENFVSGGLLSKRIPRRNIVRERNE